MPFNTMPHDKVVAAAHKSHQKRVHTQRSAPPATCKKGHPMTQDNLSVEILHRFSRKRQEAYDYTAYRCKTCLRASDAKRRYKKAIRKAMAAKSAATQAAMVVGGDRIEELLANYGGTAPVGEYRHVYNCPDRDLEAPACDCMTPDEFKAALHRLLSQEAARLARAVIGEDESVYENPGYTVPETKLKPNEQRRVQRNILRAEQRRRLDALQGGTKG